MGASTGLGYRWYRDGAPILNATSKTYTLVPEDALATVSVSVTNSSNGAYPASIVSAGVQVKGTITGVTPVMSAVGGTVKVGKKLTVSAASLSGWSPSGLTFSYVWKVAGVTKSNTSSYTPVAADAGKAVTVTVTGTKTMFEPLVKTSASVTIAP